MAVTARIDSTPATAPSPSEPIVVRPRLDAIDALRGLVMIIMALDHTRGFFSEAKFYPLDLTQTWPALFLTRWITHFCAPVFIFLAGTGAFLSTGRGKSRPELARFLVTRGLWLAFLEVSWVRCFGWTFNFDYHFVGVGVLWAIGWSMVVLGFLIFLPLRWIALLGALMVLGHNAFDGVQSGDLGNWRWLWAVLHHPETLEPAPGYRFATGYPLVPWIGVMALGYAFGSWFRLDPAVRNKRIFWTGFGAVVLFVVLRGLNLYGDPDPWVPQKTPLFSLFAILHCQKYPPSLLYLLMTLGPALLLLAAFGKNIPRWFKPVLVFGRVPLFFYLLHLPLLHAMAVFLATVQHGYAGWLFLNPPLPGAPSLAPFNYGYGLPTVYLLWAMAVATLYLPCQWFDQYKRTHRAAWLSYL